MILETKKQSRIFAFARVALVQLAAVLFWLPGLMGCVQLPWETALEAQTRLEEEAQRAYGVSDYSLARSRWQQGLELAREQGDAAGMGRINLKLARLSEELGGYQQSLEYATQALDAARVIPGLAMQARALVALGLAQRRMGRYQQAESTLEQALAVAQQQGDLATQAAALRNSAAVQQERGDFAGALERYRQALAMARQSGDRDGEAKCLNLMGGAYRQTGEYQKALDHYRRSLVLRQGLAGRGRVQGNLCLVWINLNDYQRAEADCRRALEVSKLIGDRARQANNLNNLGAIYRKRGEPERALPFYEQSLHIKRELGDDAGVVRSLDNIGEIQMRLGRWGAAQEVFSQALEMAERLGALPQESAVRHNLAVLHFFRGQYAEAIKQYEQVLILQQALGQPEELWRTYDGLSRAHAKLGRKALAIYFGKQAVNNIQALRRGIQGMERRLQRTFLDDKLDVYRRLAELLVEAGRLGEARQVLAMLKEEEFYDFVRGESPAADSATALTLDEQEWQARYQQLVADLAAIRGEYTRLARLEREGPLSDADQAAFERLKEQLEFVRAKHRDQMEALEAYYQRQGLEQRLSSSDLAHLRSRIGDLEELDDNPVLLHFFHTGDQVRIIVSGASGRGERGSVSSIWYENKISGEGLNQQIQALLDELERPTGDPLPLAQALYKQLIAPIEGILQQANAGTLALYLDDALRYLPFAVLHDGQHYLTERYRLVLYNEHADLLRQPHRDWRIAALGVSKAFSEQGFSPLPEVPYELDAIVKEGDTDALGVFPGRTFLDDSFTLGRLERILEKGCTGDDCYRVAHLATHFKLHPGDWSDSYLLLGDHSVLSLQQLFQSDYYFRHLDLLTLSACETAIWGQQSKGREIEGLGTLAQSMGAKAVIATLWKVADRSTALFMERFYRYRQQQGLSKVAALQRTQVDFIRGEAQRSVAAADAGSRGVGESAESEGASAPPYSHPFYWAPFVLMGNWL